MFWMRNPYSDLDWSISAIPVSEQIERVEEEAAEILSHELWWTKLKLRLPFETDSSYFFKAWDNYETWKYKRQKHRNVVLGGWV